MVENKRLIAIRKSNDLKNKEGITLIALVITIIVLLILAGVTISTLTGENGLLAKAEIAAQSNKDSEEEEKIKLAVYAAYIKGEGSITTQNLNDELGIIFKDLNPTVAEISSGWKLQLEKSYKIYRDGTVEKIINPDIIISFKPSTDTITAVDYEIIQINSSTENNYNINSQGWNYNKDTGISLNTTEIGDYYFYIPFTVQKTGNYICKMVLNKNEQDNATGNPLKYGISSSPVTTYSSGTFDILNQTGKNGNTIQLTEGTQYYLGAIDRLTWSQSGYSRVNFSEIMLELDEDRIGTLLCSEDYENHNIILSPYWNYEENIGLSLNTTKKRDYYYYIPFTVTQTGIYTCKMVLNRNDQENSTMNPLKYGISSSPVTTYSSNAFDILNFNEEQEKNVQLTEDTQYYLGAINRLTWNTEGWSRVNFSEIILQKKKN